MASYTSGLSNAISEYLAPGFCEAQPELREDEGGPREILCHGEPDGAGTVTLVIYRDGAADAASRKTRAELHDFHRELMSEMLPAAELRLPILESAVDVDAYFAVLMASDVPWPQLALQFVRKNALDAPPPPPAAPPSSSPPPRCAADVDRPSPDRSEAPVRPEAAAAAAAGAWVLRRAPSRHAWLVRVYAPVAGLAAVYCGLLTALGVLRPADWASGACSLAILSSPVVWAVGAAVGADFLGPGEVVPS